MKDIVRELLKANPDVRIVANAVTLETVGEIIDCIREYGFREQELTQILSVPVEVVGNYHMPKAQNPVYIAVMQYPDESVGDMQWQEL